MSLVAQELGPCKLFPDQTPWGFPGGVCTPPVLGDPEGGRSSGPPGGLLRTRVAHLRSDEGTGGFVICSRDMKQVGKLLNSLNYFF